MLRVAGWCLLRRVPQMLVVLWLLVTIVFVVVHLSPGDPTLHLALDHELPRQARLLQQQRLGLDDPILVRYGRYLASLATGDLGVSLSRYPHSVASIIAERLPRTLALLGAATAIAFVAGFAVGRWAAWRHGRLADHVTTSLSVLATTVFVPWVAFSAIWLFAFGLGWLPSGRMITPAVWRDAAWTVNQVLMVAMLFALVVAVLVGGALVIWARARSATLVARARVAAVAAATVMALAASVAAVHPMRPYVMDIVWHTVLPTLTVTVLAFGATALLTRTAMLEAMGADHVTVARAHGLDERVVRHQHVVRVSLQPLAASLVLAAAGVVGGSVVFESIFSWPGLGMTLMDAAVAGDIPLVVGSLMMYAVVFLVLHAVLEIVQPMLDPRLRGDTGRTTGSGGWRRRRPSALRRSIDGQRP